MQKIYVMIFALLTITNYSYAEDKQLFQFMQQVEGNRDFLEIFSEEEKYIILLLSPIIKSLPAMILIS